MTVTDLPVASARRDVKGMTERLKTLRDGHRLLVTFKRENYGIFTVDGAAVLSPSVKTFMVGSLFIESGLKPEKAVQAIEDRDIAGEVMTEDREKLQEIITSVNHGDLVSATFEQPPHGRFTVTGVAVETAEGDIMAVGTWFLAQRATAAPRVQALTVLADAGTHHSPVPAPITAWESDEPTTV